VVGYWNAWDGLFGRAFAGLVDEALQEPADWWEHQCHEAKHQCEVHEDAFQQASGPAVRADVEVWTVKLATVVQAP